LLIEAGRRSLICNDLEELCTQLERGAATVVVTEETLAEN
jgi:hypothetical protein